ncbi:hypothetical protein DY218_08695 [Streptomyces triticagri]|uniref:DUF6194 domain-containing protein n=1 Tax=Streptomyces triticagri TaxID=2293568 RepID=A0A372M8F7_9ACTN|nr:DUF6194 family protein [Streptomyces triticagri]RFU87119.1 hypothetical protein DY218_08695 [Streptomyces triticagri]
MDRIVRAVRGFDGALVTLPAPGSEYPELAWGDAFFSYAPDGRLPQHTQPYGTIVTKNYPGDTSSDLDRPGRFRVNIHVGRQALRELVGEQPDGDGAEPAVDPAAADTIGPHPVYAAQGWIAVVAPGPRTLDTVLRLLAEAHDAARTRHERRGAR